MSMDLASGEELRELLAQFQREGQDLSLEELVALKSRINARYWELVTDAVRQATRELSPGQVEPIPFPQEQLDFLNFGLVGEAVSEEDKQQRERLHAELAPDGERTKVILLAHAFDRAYHRLLKLEYENKLIDREASIRERIEDSKVQIERLQLEREELIQRLVRAEDSETLVRLNTEVERDLVRFYPFKRRQQTHGLASEDRKLFLELRERLLSGNRRRDALLEQYPAAEPVKELSKRIQDGLRTGLELQSLLEDLSQKVLDVRQERERMSPIELQKNLLEEARHFQFFTRVAAKRARQEPQSVPLGGRVVVTPGQVVQTLNELEDYDPELFWNRQARHEGRPSILILPGTGHGLYDWSRNCLVVPSLPPTNLRNSVIQACILYRLDVDKHRQNNELLNAYRTEIKENFTIRSVQRLRERLVKDYYLWMTKEVHGYQVQSRASREWFERHIAPNKNDVIVPSEFRHVQAKKLRESIPRYQATCKGAERHRYLGVLFFLIREMEQALAEFKEAIRLEPEYPWTYFNAGVAARRLNLREAQSYFQKFVRKSSLNWWSRKAQEHLRKFR